MAVDFDFTWDRSNPLLAALESLVVSNGAETAAPPSGAARLVVLAYPALDESDGTAFFEDLSRLDRNRYGSGLVVYWPDPTTRPWDLGSHLGARERGAFEKVVSCVRSPAELQALQQATIVPPPVWAIKEVTEVREARRLFEVLRGFSHGVKHDVTNQVLGPARLLLKAAATDPVAGAVYTRWAEELDAASWDSFLCQVVRPLESSLSEQPENAADGERLSSELVDYANALPVRLVSWEVRHVPAIEALTAALTTTRTRAGAKTDDHPGRPIYAEPSEHEPVALGDAKAASRVLVVDDHARSWKGVFGIAHKALEEKLESPVRIDFSLDGHTLATGGDGPSALLGVVADYDVILLDIFLGEVRGLELLREIRSVFLYLPVVIWTTSRDIDLPASANLANGFLFKKTTDVTEIVNTLGRWLEHGRAARAVTLPNRFFDHTIHMLEHRQAIRSLTLWALQLLDAFPALDDSFFRNFTDHGGRHFVQLLEHMEQMVRPLLLAGGFFAEDAAQREEEITALYLALTCHEFGMFPVFPGEVAFDNLRPEQSDAVRSLHAVRGLQFLARKETWGDFRQVGEGVLKPDGFLGVAVPLIVGYHSRLLPIDDSRTGFGTIPEKVAARIDKLQDLAARDGRRVLVLPNAAELRETLLTLIGSRQLDCRRDVVRRLCGLVRFVDAIDVERSRLPSRFLRNMAPEATTPEAKKARATSRREYLKRELVARVDVDRGKVSFDLICPRPSEKTCDEIVAILGEPTTLPLEPVLAPWISEHRERIKGLRPAIDQELQAIFLTPETALPTSVEDPRRAVATLAAIVVAGEILEEYQALKECSLAHVIRLDQFRWGTEEAWRPEDTEVESLPRPGQP